MKFVLFSISAFFSSWVRDTWRNCLKSIISLVNVRITLYSNWCHKNNYLRIKKNPNQKEYLRGIVKQNMPEAVLFAVARSTFPQSSIKAKKNEDWQIVNPLYTSNIKKVIFKKIYKLFPLVSSCLSSALPRIFFSF